MAVMYVIVPDGVDTNHSLNTRTRDKALAHKLCDQETLHFHRLHNVIEIHDDIPVDNFYPEGVYV